MLILGSGLSSTPLNRFGLEYIALGTFSVSLPLPVSASSAVTARNPAFYDTSRVPTLDASPQDTENLPPVRPPDSSLVNRYCLQNSGKAGTGETERNSGKAGTRLRGTAGKPALD